MTSSPVWSRTVAAPKRSRPAFANTRPTTTECTTTSGGSADCRSDPASRKAPASESSAADSMGLNAPLVEGRSQRLARRQTLFQEQPLGRLPRFEGLQCRSRLTKKRETHALPVPPMPKIAIFCSLTLFCIFRTPLVLSAHLHAGQRRASIRRINRPDTRMHSAKCPVLDRE